MDTIILTENYGYTSFSISNLDAYSVIDAKSASWIVSNSRNPNPDADTSWEVGTGELNTYPFKVSNGGTGLLIIGGSIWGEVPQTSDWLYTYNNSAAIRIEFTPGVIIDDWRIDSVWDAIRIAKGSHNFLIDDAYISNVRDDAVENDYVLSGTIRDSLFDGVFSGISLGSSSHYDGSGNVIVLEGVFIRSQSYLYKGELTHVSPFKTDTSAPETTPDIRIINSVIAIEDPNHAGQARLALAWANVVESRGNVFLNLSDTPLPSSYPLPGSGFTILQGQVARDYWEAVKAAWLDNHDGTPFAEITPLPPLPGTEVSTPPPTTAPAVPEPEPTTRTIDGTNGANTLSGTSAVDYINGHGGHDFLYGKGGSDVLTGGRGKDVFVFDTALDGSVARIMDFNVRDDSIYLDNAIFTKLGSGSLSSPTKLNKSWFKSGPGAEAEDSNDYILYDSTTGLLSYDADGSGVGAPVPIAQLSANLNLSSVDILII